MARACGDSLSPDMAQPFFDLCSANFLNHANDAWLNAEYFRQVFTTMRDSIDLSVCLQDGKWVGAVLCVAGRSNGYSLYWGQSGEIRFLHFEQVFYRRLERDEEKWNPVFLANHATTEKLEHDEVSIKHHHALERACVTGLDKLDFGPTGAHKAARGIGIEPIHHALWFRNPAFREIGQMACARKTTAAETERLPFVPGRQASACQT